MATLDRSAVGSKGLNGAHTPFIEGLQMENAPSKSWLGSLVVGSEVTYHYSLGSFPAVVSEIGEHCIWLGIKIGQNEFYAKVSGNGCGPYSSRISQRESDICELSPHWESHLPPLSETF